jgi:hypothetical protein
LPSLLLFVHLGGSRSERMSTVRCLPAQWPVEPDRMKNVHWSAHPIMTPHGSKRLSYDSHWSTSRLTTALVKQHRARIYVRCRNIVKTKIKPACATQAFSSMGCTPRSALLGFRSCYLSDASSSQGRGLAVAHIPPLCKAKQNNGCDVRSNLSGGIERALGRFCQRASSRLQPKAEHL